MNPSIAKQADESESLFPLPLSDFEFYMFVDNRPSYPMVFTMIVHLSGSLDRTHFTAAVNSALSCHPLLNCRVQKLSGRGWCWVADLGASPMID
ncbi:MAG: hypothetical protein DWI21_12225 [Planctomycetota bacterium]|nr:MAG: hypothetical protein DWI21_12225 [Planctomycetota bacterium]